MVMDDVAGAKLLGHHSRRLKQLPLFSAAVNGVGKGIYEGVSVAVTRGWTNAAHFSSWSSWALIPLPCKPP